MTDGVQSGAVSADAEVPASHGPKKGGGPLRGLYNFVLKLAGGKQAEPALFAVSFAESSFFPIPPDVMLMPMVLAKPQRGYRFALICSLGSIFGAMLGYAIGYLLYDSVGKPIISFFGYAGKEADLQKQYAEAGVWIIFLKGLTPIPFKLVTIVSGFMKFDFAIFLAACAITRSARFFIEAWVFKTYGPTLGPIIEKRIGLFMLGAAAIIVAGFVVAAMLH